MVNKKEISGDISFVNEQGKVVHPSKEDYNARKSANVVDKSTDVVGKAYAFLDCDASKEQIELTIPSIRRDAQTPDGLELLLNEGISGLKLDRKLRKAIQYPDDYRVLSEKRREQGYEQEAIPAANLRYALTANLPKASNLTTAKELRDIANLIGLMNEDSTIYRCAVVYAEEDSGYRLLE